MGIMGWIAQVAPQVPYPPGAQVAVAIMGIVSIVILILVILPFWRIFSKAGFPGWLSLTAIVPPLFLIVIYYLAFAEWPALSKKDTGQPQQTP